MIKAIVEIRLKRGVLDAQGKAIEEALKQSDFDGLDQVRVGKLVELTFAKDDDVEAKVEALCEQLIVNHEMEEYSYTIKGSGDE